MLTLPSVLRAWITCRGKICRHKDQGNIFNAAISSGDSFLSPAHLSPPRHEIAMAFLKCKLHWVQWCNPWAWGRGDRICTENVLHILLLFCTGPGQDSSFRWASHKEAFLHKLRAWLITSKLKWQFNRPAWSGMLLTYLAEHSQLVLHQLCKQIFHLNLLCDVSLEQ